MALKVWEYFRFMVVMYLVSILIFLLVSFFFSGFHFTQNLDLKMVNHGMRYFQSIMFNNLANFIQYFVFFVISPLLITIDLVTMIYQIYVSVQIRGTGNTIALLWKHGIVEVPNMFLYMCLSFKSLQVLWQSKKLQNLIDFWMQNKKWYMLSLVLIVIASFIEGMVA